MTFLPTSLVEFGWIMVDQSSDKSIFLPQRFILTIALPCSDVAKRCKKCQPQDVRMLVIAVLTKWLWNQQQSGKKRGSS